MFRFMLSACFVATFAVTTSAQGQRPGAFLLADSLPTEEPVPLVPQSTDMEEKNPWAAFFFSMLIPGGGQFYNDEGRKGLLMLTGAAAGFGIAVYGLSDTQEESSESITQTDTPTSTSTTILRRYEETYNETAVNIGLLVFLASATWSMIDAPISSNRINQEARQTSLQINPIITPDFAGASLSLKF